MVEAINGKWQWFGRMHMLLGTRPNVKPVYLMQVGIPPELLPPTTPPSLRSLERPSESPLLAPIAPLSQSPVRWSPEASAGQASPVFTPLQLSNPPEFAPPPRLNTQESRGQAKPTRHIAKRPAGKRRLSQQPIDESDNLRNFEEQKKLKTTNKAPTEMDQLLSIATSIDKSVEAQQRRFEARQQFKESKFDRKMALAERQLALAERQAQFGFGIGAGMMQPGMMPPGTNVPGQQPP